MLFLPDAISFETAATILLQGLTAHYLATDSHKTQKRNSAYPCFSWSRSILTQISKAISATVIGLTSSVSKETALKNGADKVFYILKTGNLAY
jgi:NADPH2:quinone reductase